MKESGWTIAPRWNSQNHARKSQSATGLAPKTHSKCSLTCCRARDKEKGTICALKKIKMDKHQDGFPLTSIREINILLSFHHPNIVEVCQFPG